jgi:hypothetical protein
VLTLRFQTIRWVALTVFIIEKLMERSKIIANFLLHRIEPVKNTSCESFENHKDAKSSVVVKKTPSAMENHWDVSRW